MIGESKRILAVGAHPDDVELGCGGTLAKLASEGHEVSVIDLTRGELGTRGNAEIRLVESTAAARILGVSNRFNMEFRDGFFVNDEYHQKKLISFIRFIRPHIIIGNAHYDRHPDHGRACSLIRDAVFFSGLAKIETRWDSVVQEAWRPLALYHFIQAILVKPDFVVDVSAFWETKLQSVLAYKTQFYSEDNVNEPQTYISSPQFLDSISARGRELGINQGFHFAEGFTAPRIIGVRDISQLV